MDAGVMRSIDAYQSKSTKGTESINDFWSQLDKPVTFKVEDSPQPLVTSPHLFSCESPEQTAPASKQHRSKKRKCSESKNSVYSQDLSALDCSDYWLRFDSDTESVGHGPEADNNNQGTAQSRSYYGSFQPVLRGGLGYPGDFGLDSRSPSNDFIDDSPLENALSEEEDLFSMALNEEMRNNNSGAVPTEVPPRETLYSTPLSWDPPQAGVRLENYLNMNPTFNNPEQRRLLAIAMGTGQSFPSDANRQDSMMEFNFDELAQSPSTTNSSNATGQRRKSPTNRPQAPMRADSMDKNKSKPRSSERAAHNDIERKYRTNLKDRISDLRDAVPSLRAIPEDPDDDSPVASSRSAPKVSKGTILTKATEYIHQLERRNRSMAKKNEELCRRLQAFEQLVGAGTTGPNWQSQGYGTAVFNPRTFS